jgi:hypothetical protein
VSLLLPRPWDLFEFHLLGVPEELLQPDEEYLRMVSIWRREAGRPSACRGLFKTRYPAIRIRFCRRCLACRNFPASRSGTAWEHQSVEGLLASWNTIGDHCSRSRNLPDDPNERCALANSTSALFRPAAIVSPNDLKRAGSASG